MMEMLHQPARNEQDPIVQTESGPSARQIMASLKAVVLMAGSVRASKLDASIGRSMMQLPIDSSTTLMDQWRRETEDLAETFNLSSLTVRIMVDGHSTEPPKPQDGLAAFTVERDPLDFRGTGGVLHDLSAGYEDDDYLLVANGLQVLTHTLTETAGLLAERGGDVSIVAHRDGTPSGLMLVRCGVLRRLPAAGFVDMKEQALPTIAQKHSVRVVGLDQPSALPVRTLSDYMHALRVHHRRYKNAQAAQDPFAEDLQSSYSVIEPGADVSDTARIHDSVVLAGAKVHPDAILVRSLVCPGAVVGRGQRVVDRLAAPARAANKRGDSAWA